MDNPMFASIEADGFVPPPPQNNCNTATQGCTLEQYSKAKQLPLDFLKRIGVTEGKTCGVPFVRIPYLDQSEKEACVRHRHALERSSSGA